MRPTVLLSLLVAVVSMPVAAQGIVIPVRCEGAAGVRARDFELVYVPAQP